MHFQWPNMLWFLAAAPFLVAVYWLLMRRRSRAAVRYASVAAVKEALGPAQRIRRHIPPALLLLALLAVMFAMARPSANITLPSHSKSIVLAVDVSLSMRATDVSPDRITAAQAAAKAFLEELPANVRVGIVSFAGSASVVQSPTNDRESLLAAVDRLQLQRHTATGSGLILSLATLLPEAGIDVEALNFGAGFSSRYSNGGGSRKAIEPKTPEKPFTAVPPGSYSSGVIILLSDGRRTTGPDPLDAAKMAADRGVRVYTVGFGTKEGGPVDFGGWSIYMKLDEETLKAVADITRAEYYFAGTADDLRKVYQALNAKVVLEKKETELGALFSAAAALLALAAAALSMRWFGRV